MQKRQPPRRRAGKNHPRRRQGSSSPDSQKLRASILREVARRPLDASALAAALDLPPAWRQKLPALLADMERSGDIARIRKDRYIVPKEADLFTGIIQFHMNGSAHVLNEKAGGRDLLVRAENTLTAMHGDRVVARIGTPPPEPGFFRGPERQPEGRVIRIVERANDTIVGTLQRTKNFFHVVADDPRFVHNLYVKPPAPPLSAKPGDKVVAKLEIWESRHTNPEGRITEVLGPADAPGVDMLSIIRRHRLPLEFPADVQRDAERTPPEVSAHDAASREDMRSAFVFTIDPDDARDFDDAINIERTAAGWRVGIHIADVSHYVKPGTPLDREALARGNSTYLADRVIPMLPEALSNGICSLKPQVDRLAFSVFAEVSEKGKILSARFAKTVIRSAARLTYRQALAILEKPAGNDPLARNVHTAWELSSTLRKKRFAAGSLDLDFPEVKVWLDENGRPVRLERMENDISHQLIEELMLLANELVARELKIRRQPSLYRIHETPDPDKLAEFREFALTQGIRAGDLTNRAEIVKILAAIRGKPFGPAVRIALLKSLKRARYFPEPVGHYGLAKPDYTHFTSPIRRYSDLVVHRALERRLGLSKKGPDSTGLTALSDHISATERTSAEAEKESVRLKKLEYFQLQLRSDRPHRFEAIVIDVRNFGAFVELPEFLLTGLVHISSLEGDFYIHDAARARLVARKSKKTIALGDRIQVAVARVDMFKQQVDFKPA
ncbi:MAG: ribonuclease R [Terrimicrobiaceae bacterium]